MAFGCENGLVQLVEGDGIQRIELRRAIESDEHDPILDLDTDVLEANVLFFFGHCDSSRGMRAVQARLIAWTRTADIVAVLFLVRVLLVSALLRWFGDVWIVLLGCG